MPNEDPPTVLVVDDDARNRMLARACLERSYNVVEAEDGPSALQLLERTAVDLVLLDVMMPGMSGMEVCKAIKKRQGSIFLPVILLTALSEREDRHRGLEAGADDFLLKPLDTRELMLRVKIFLQLRTNQVEMARQQATIRRQLEELRVLDGLKDDLVSLLVHDLRNPLTGIVGFLGLMRDDADAETRDDLDRAIAAADKLRESVEDLLQVRLLEEGRVPIDLRSQSLRELLQEAMVTVEGAAKERDVDLRIQLDPDFAISVDHKLVRRAVENILINAVKYSPRHSAVDLTVARPSDGVTIEIGDRGPGVPDTHKTNLFEKFGRVASAQTQRPGYGLGLYLVKLVAGAHGGEASVRDREGGGSVFQLFLPTPTPAPTH